MSERILHILTLKKLYTFSIDASMDEEEEEEEAGEDEDGAEDVDSMPDGLETAEGRLLH